MGEYLLIAATGLLGSSHCLGMCGPIVWAYAARLPAHASATQRLASHLAYNLGRVGMWAFLG
ncbi:MAG: sulfite exporter TauE/SafE family protein, partial [Candidatus Brocadiae bacterium]|nr:sulfite exporter TauE/SafE family protein [Candidatus Brocadiia bacterium]